MLRKMTMESKLHSLNDNKVTPTDKPQISLQFAKIKTDHLNCISKIVSKIVR